MKSREQQVRIDMGNLNFGIAVCFDVLSSLGYVPTWDLDLVNRLDVYGVPFLCGVGQ